MQKALLYQSHLFISKPNLFFNPIIEKSIIFNPKCITFSEKSPHSRSLSVLSHQTHIAKPVISSRKRSKPSGSQKLIKILPKIVSTIAASNLNILPDPFNLLVSEFIGGNGGSNGGGGDSWFRGGFDGWRGRGKKTINVGFLLLGFLVVCEILFGKEMRNTESFYGFLGLSQFFAIIFVKGFKRGMVKDLILVGCLVGALMGLRFKRVEMQKWVRKVRTWPPVLQVMNLKGKKRRHNRTRFL